MAACTVVTGCLTVYMGIHGAYDESRAYFRESILSDNAIDRAYDFLNMNVHFEEDDKGNTDVSISRYAFEDEDYDFIVKVNGKTLKGNYDKEEKYLCSSDYAYGGYDDEEVTVKAYLKDGREAAASVTWINRAYNLRYVIPSIALALAILVIGGIVLIIRGTGMYFRKVPADLYTVAAFIVIFLAVNMVKEYEYSLIMSILYLLVVGTFCTAVFLLWLIGITGQVRGGVLIESTVIYRVLRVLREGFRHLPDVWKIVVPSALVICVAFMVISVASYGEAAGIALICGILLLAAIWYLAIMMNRITDGARAVRGGDTSHEIDTRKMCPVLREHAETVNDISRAVDAAVEEKMKSERMKTELITNVSHDIKTPLTSIINYTELLAGEEQGSDRAKEYIETISANAARLKKLTSDIVEASKISTGNITVERRSCDLKTMLDQALGEYEEKMKKLNLTPVVKLPEEDVRVLADGEHSWRIIDNLMNNICKYAQPGTRVYMEIYREGDYGCISFKNVSAGELDISPDELMERFVRGDESRSTEGSGLGLSISGDLAKAQDGRLDISIDGDLFKSIIRFEIDADLK